jgi:hypothetical protein
MSPMPQYSPLLALQPELPPPSATPERRKRQDDGGLRTGETRRKALIDAAQAGEEADISNGDAGSIQLVPCQAPSAPQASAPRRPGRLRGKIKTHP